MCRPLLLSACALSAACATTSPATRAAVSAPAEPGDHARTPAGPAGTHHGAHEHAAADRTHALGDGAGRPAGTHHGAHEHAAADRTRATEDGPGSHAHAGHAHGGPVGHRFEDAAQWSRVFDDPSRDAWQKPAHVVALVGIRPGMTVVDLGAGTGYFVTHLATAVGPGGRVIALDPEPGMVAHIDERMRGLGVRNVEARQIPFDDPRLPAASVQRILIVDTWHHIAERATYAAKLASALAPAGAVYVVDFTQETEKGPPKHHRVTPTTVIAELEAAGLRAELLADEQLPDQFVVRASKP